MEKPIIEETPEVITGNPAAYWDLDKFRQGIWDQGYNVYLDKALRCPCVNKSTGQPLTTCQNCNGWGWIFLNRKKTRVLMHGMNYDKKYSNWSEETMGTASVTTLPEDRITVMDRIINLDLEAIYTQILRVKLFKKNVFAFTIYEPLEIELAYRFNGDDKKLIILQLNVDFTLEGNKVIFDYEKYKNLYQEMQVSVRYFHNPTYHVLDVTRDMISRKSLVDCEGEQSTTLLQKYPSHYMAKRAHLIPDARNFDSGIFENSTEDA